MIRPVSPNEIPEIMLDGIPNEVISVFNELIKKNWNGRLSKFNKADIELGLINAFRERGIDMKLSTIYNNRWLDVYEIYSNMGWKIKFENYYQDYIFSK